MLDKESEESLEKMNKCFDNLTTAVKYLEEIYEEMNTYMLLDKMKQQVEKLLFNCSRVVNCDKLLMKNVRSVFSKVHIAKSLEGNINENNNHTCEICGKKLRSKYILEEHHFQSKWACLTCQHDMYSQYNLLKHNREPCE